VIIRSYISILHQTSFAQEEEWWTLWSPFVSTLFSEMKWAEAKELALELDIKYKMGFTSSYKVLFFETLAGYKMVKMQVQIISWECLPFWGSLLLAIWMSKPSVFPLFYRYG
jgi:hypothetical protein